MAARIGATGWVVDCICCYLARECAVLVDDVYQLLYAAAQMGEVRRWWVRDFGCMGGAKLKMPGKFNLKYWKTTCSSL